MHNIEDIQRCKDTSANTVHKDMQVQRCVIESTLERDIAIESVLIMLLNGFDLRSRSSPAPPAFESQD